MNNKQVYILSLEASDIWSHMYRGTDIKYNYCGMIPYSLELIKLRKEGLKVRYIEERDKEISNDIINVKFNSKVRSGRELKNIMQKKIDKTDSQTYKEKMELFIDNIKDSNDIWREISINKLREILYTEGFFIEFYDKKRRCTKKVEYLVYKRSSSKSRTGQCLFIKKSLYNKMIKWSRMDLPFKKNTELDLASLLAYESLVGSSLEKTLKLNPDNILMVSDVESKFNQICNVIKKGENGFLDSFVEETLVSNSLFDGESLLDSKYFNKNEAMLLLRNHMFKSAAFNTNIQLFLRDHCPKDIPYEDWQITDIFGNKLYAKNIEMITTPSSLKAFKFSNVIGTDKDMWNYWKQKVKEDDNLFGVCKHEKASKIGTDENGNVLQQTSYQMINCLPIDKNDIEELITTEKKYINRLKNDDDFFIEKVFDSRNIINSHDLLVSLYKINPKIINTKMFRKFRKDFVQGHMLHSKKGKIKLHGDYCVMLGNPIEFLYHAIGQFNINKNISSLKNNEVYTTLLDFEKEYVGFRNPNTSPSNVLIVKNKRIPEIEKYFNLTENIVCVNAINFPLQDILSGSDYDSDTVLLFDNPKLLKLGKECFNNYRVCINQIDGQKKKYKLNPNDMCQIDNQLSESQKNIGRVVNLGQFCMSVYWDLINKNEIGEETEELLKKVDVMTILSGIAIDMAKKFYDIDIDKEIKNVEKNPLLKRRKKKPMFWEFVSQSKTIKNRIEFYDCPMDYLIHKLNSVSVATYRRNIDFNEFIIEKDLKNVNYKQFDKIIKKIKEMDNLIRLENTKHIDNDERKIKIEDIIRDHLYDIKKLKINEDTMIMLIKYINDTENKIMLRMLNMFYLSHTEKFLKLFKKG